MAKFNTPEEVDNAKNRVFTMPKKHMCWNCPWVRVLDDRFYCLFVSGSCARIPKTINEPDEQLVSARARMSMYSATEEDRERLNGGGIDQ